MSPTSNLHTIQPLRLRKAEFAPVLYFFVLYLFVLKYIHVGEFALTVHAEQPYAKGLRVSLRC
jgi:hypothetical protein